MKKDYFHMSEVGYDPTKILLANSTFEGAFYFSQAWKVVHIPHREEKKDLFCGIFPHFLNSPTVSLTGEHAQATLRGRPRGRLGRVGSGTYNFLVTGVNGGDIRIQITDPANNNAIKYDTQPGDPATATPTTTVTGNVIAHN
jgi:hypothetical protein